MTKKENENENKKNQWENGTVYTNISSFERIKKQWKEKSFEKFLLFFKQQWKTKRLNWKKKWINKWNRNKIHNEK